MKAPVGRPKRTQKSEVALDRAFIEAAALRYLNRFDASVAKLRTKLTQTVKRRFEIPADDPRLAQVPQWIEQVLARLVESGVLNDARFANLRAESLRARGTSQRMISQKLRLAGVGGEQVQGALAEADRQQTEPELVAAQRLVRRRKLGWCRAEAVRKERHLRDLGVLARAGFSHGTSLRALKEPPEEP